MLKEGNQRRRRTDELLRRDVHVLTFHWIDHRVIVPLARLYQIILERAVLIDKLVGLGNRVSILLIGREELDFVCRLAVNDLAVGGLKETEIIHASVGTQRRNQTDVWSFRRLNRTDATVVRVVDVTHLEPGSLATETTGTKCRQTTFVRQLVEWIVLLHELRQL